MRSLRIELPVADKHKHTYTEPGLIEIDFGALGEDFILDTGIVLLLDSRSIPH